MDRARGRRRTDRGDRRGSQGGGLTLACGRPRAEDPARGAGVSVPQRLPADLGDGPRRSTPTPSCVSLLRRFDPTPCAPSGDLHDARLRRRAAPRTPDHRHGADGHRADGHDLPAVDPVRRLQQDPSVKELVVPRLRATRRSRGTTTGSWPSSPTGCETGRSRPRQASRWRSVVGHRAAFADRAVTEREGERAGATHHSSTSWTSRPATTDGSPSDSRAASAASHAKIDIPR